VPPDVQPQQARQVVPALDSAAPLSITAGAASHVHWGTSINPPNGDSGAFNGVPVRGWTPNSTGNAFCLRHAASRRRRRPDPPARHDDHR
jgi:hypothetical protein